MSDGLVKTKDITITSNRKEGLVMAGEVMVVVIAAIRRAGNRMHVGIMRAGKLTVGIVGPGTMMVGTTPAGKMTGIMTTVENDKVGGACFYVVAGSLVNQFHVRLPQENDKLN